MAWCIRFRNPERISIQMTHGQKVKTDKAIFFSDDESPPPHHICSFPVYLHFDRAFKHTQIMLTIY